MNWSSKKAVLLLSLVFALGLGTVCFIFVFPRDQYELYKEGNVAYSSKLEEGYFWVYQEGAWKKLFIKGVNLGAAKPGAFPSEYAIQKEEYARWLEYIGDMNANAIRIYTILNPEFYEALYEYNQTADQPIYLFHGVWINENDIKQLQDAYNPKILDTLKQDIQHMVDVVHGNCTLPGKPWSASGTYNKDISPYVIGWILGIEWDANFVVSTNKKNPDIKEYQGNYLSLLAGSKGSPFECWLAECSDYTINYETKQYETQRPLSFVNWPTTDVLTHPNEPDAMEDMVSIDMEKIKWNASFRPGLFASYHIYPYYPDFLNYQPEYAAFKDPDGKTNTYRAYLNDLKKVHTLPIVVSEFGVPSSRGIAHESIQMGFNQGYLTETQQGEMDAAMLKDIHEEHLAGGLVFSWQDEWFKRTWNTMDLDIEDRRPYWSNPQTNEQKFGLLAFDPGKEKSVCYVDGDAAEWEGINALTQGKENSLFVQSDEKYLYFMAKIKDFKEDTTLIIPIDTLESQGNTQVDALGLQLKRPSEFVVIVHGQKDARILVDAYYDPFYYLYKEFNIVDKNIYFNTKNSGHFNPIHSSVSGELYLPQEKRTVPPKIFETGRLQFGNANPAHPEYNSLSDIAVDGDTIEIRIPWQLLNVMDPSKKKVMDDLHKDGIKPLKIRGLYAGLTVLGHNQGIQNTEMNLYTWKDWDQPTYHERLKKSYFILKEAFEALK